MPAPLIIHAHAHQRLNHGHGDRGHDASGRHAPRKNNLLIEKLKQRQKISVTFS